MYRLKLDVKRKRWAALFIIVALLIIFFPKESCGSDFFVDGTILKTRCECFGVIGKNVFKNPFMLASVDEYACYGFKTGENVKTTEFFTIPPGGAYCDKNGTFHVAVKNIGQIKISDDYWSVAEVKNSTYKIRLETSELYPGETSDFSNTSSDGKGQPGKEYIVNVGNYFKNIGVYCP